MSDWVPVIHRSTRANDKYFAVPVLATRHAGHIRWIIDDNTVSALRSILVALIRRSLLISSLSCDGLFEVVAYLRKTALRAR